MSTTNRTPTWAEIIRVALERRLMDTYVSMPGVVLDFNPAQQTATVQPSLRKLGPDPTGTDKVNPLPPLRNVPVLFFGSGSWRVTVPVNANDQVMLLWSDRGLDRWKGTIPGTIDGTVAPPTQTIDPGSNNLHHLADAVAILGLVPPAAPRLSTANDRMSIGMDGGAVIEVLPARVNLGAGASEQLVKGTSYGLHMTALANALSALNAAISPLMLPPAAAAAKAAVQLAITAANNLAGDISSTSFTA
jgi:hypothetical protein